MVARARPRRRTLFGSVVCETVERMTVGLRRSHTRWRALEGHVDSLKPVTARIVQSGVSGTAGSRVS